MRLTSRFNMYLSTLEIDIHRGQRKAADTIFIYHILINHILSCISYLYSIAWFNLIGRVFVQDSRRRSVWFDEFNNTIEEIQEPPVRF